jgi:hypothetical protein
MFIIQAEVLPDAILAILSNALCNMFHVLRIIPRSLQRQPSLNMTLIIPLSSHTNPVFDPRSRQFQPISCSHTSGQPINQPLAKTHLPPTMNIIIQLSLRHPLATSTAPSGTSTKKEKSNISTTYHSSLPSSHHCTHPNQTDPSTTKQPNISIIQTTSLLITAISSSTLSVKQD